MEELIAFCGLACSECPSHVATQKAHGFGCASLPGVELTRRLW